MKTWKSLMRHAEFGFELDPNTDDLAETPPPRDSGLDFSLLSLWWEWRFPISCFSILHCPLAQLTLVAMKYGWLTKLNMNFSNHLKHNILVLRCFHRANHNEFGLVSLLEFERCFVCRNTGSEIDMANQSYWQLRLCFYLN